MIGVRVVRWRVANELVDEELVVVNVLSKVVDLLFEVFCELLVQKSQKERVWVVGFEEGHVFLCKSCQVCVNEIVEFVGQRGEIIVELM